MQELQDWLEAQPHNTRLNRMQELCIHAGVTAATLRRYAEGKTVPNRHVQKAIMEWIKKH